METVQGGVRHYGVKETLVVNGKWIYPIVFFSLSINHYNIEEHEGKPSDLDIYRLASA